VRCTLALAAAVVANRSGLTAGVLTWNRFGSLWLRVRARRLHQALAATRYSHPVGSQPTTCEERQRSHA